MDHTPVRYRTIVSRLAAIEDRVGGLDRSLVALREVMQEGVDVLCHCRERDHQSIHDLSERMTREAHAVRDLIDAMRGIDTRDPEPEPPPAGPVLH